MTKCEETIIKAVCQEYRLSPEVLCGRERRREVAEARFLAMQFMRARGLTFQQIARAFNRTHSTVIFGVRNVANMIEFDRNFARRYEHLALILEQND